MDDSLVYHQASLYPNAKRCSLFFLVFFLKIEELTRYVQEVPQQAAGHSEIAYQAVQVTPTMPTFSTVGMGFVVAVLCLGAAVYEHVLPGGLGDKERVEMQVEE